jgi:hypothetical protein
LPKIPSLARPVAGSLPRIADAAAASAEMMKRNWVMVAAIALPEGVAVLGEGSPKKSVPISRLTVSTINPVRHRRKRIKGTGNTAPV